MSTLMACHECDLLNQIPPLPSRGSANMDRRSFELNYDNNILFYDRSLTAEMRHRQETYLAQSKPVTIDMVDQCTWHRRLWNNCIAMLGPVL